MNELLLTIDRYRNELVALSEHPVRNRSRIQAMKSKMQVIEECESRRVRMHVQSQVEAQRDILNTAVTGLLTVGAVIDKNNYTNYEKQVQAAYEMYDGLAKYGSEILPAVTDIRVAFIAGEGVSIYSDNKAKMEFLQRFIKHNFLSGSKLLSAVLMTELEGRTLFLLKSIKAKDASGVGNVDARLFSWWRNKYTVKRNKEDYESIESIEYTTDDSSEPKKIDLEHSVYIKTGGCNYKDDKTPSKIGKVLTQCENASRAAFDLRKNTHLFGRVFPFWKTATSGEAKTINDIVQSKSFEIGDAYAGPADLSLLEPSGSSADALIKDMQNSLRFVAASTGVPIHWLAWPELMSNRATAENMLEVVSAATKKERLILQEQLLVMFDKVCQIGVDELAEDKSILEGDLEVRLPLISLASLQQLIDVWQPVLQEGLISRFTFRNMLPGIDPTREDELIKKEKDEDAKNSPMQNSAASEALQQIKDNNAQPIVDEEDLNGDQAE